MQVFDGIEKLPKAFPASVVTIGNFDGVHRGHQKLLEALKRHGKQQNAPCLVMTFEPHPMKILFPERAVYRLFSLKDQEQQLKSLGIDYLIRQKFDKKLAQTTAEEFFQKYLLKPLRPKAVVIGHDFHFGKGRQGDFTLLKGWGDLKGIPVEQVQPYQIDGQTVSSSKIKELIAQGELDKAYEFLGRQYYIDGRVGEGFGRGKKMGFPTANIPAPPGVALPKGVYVTRVHHRGQSDPAVTNVGLSPTFEDVNPVLRVENYILDLSKDLYNEEIKVEFFKYLRPERKFKDAKELTEQIAQDVRAAREYWNGTR